MRTVAAVGLVGASLLALAAIFPWGDLQQHAHWRRVVWVPFAGRTLRPFDIATNLALFIPVGILAAHACRRRALVCAATVTVAVSVTGEWLQVYSHTRFPSATDVVCNAAGALIAAALVQKLKRASASEELPAPRDT